MFTVSNAIQGESIDLTPPYTANGADDDPDVSSGAQYRTIISYSDKNQFLNDLPWTIFWPGFNNNDNMLDPGEKAEITVWLFDRDNNVANATDSNGIKVSLTGGLTSSSTIPSVNDKFTLEVKPESGATLNIQRTLPGRLDSIIDLR